MTDEQKPLELSRARKHDILQAPMPGGRIAGSYVMSRCDRLDIAYYDEVTKKSYPNLGALIEAVRASGGRHHIAARCVFHKWLEEVPQELIDAITAAVGEGAST
jgi:hypothetical protein